MSAIKRRAADLALAESKKPKVNASITSFFGAPKPTNAIAGDQNASIATKATVTSSGPDSKTTTTVTQAVNPDAAPASIFGVGGGATETPTKKFDKSAWVDSLKPEQRDLLQLEIDTLDESWLAVLKEEITSPRFLGLKKFLAGEIAKGNKVFPPMEDVYSW